MNFYKLARDLDTFIKECQEAAKKVAEELPEEFSGHFDCLDPFEKELHRFPWVLEDKSYHYMDATNYRVDIFETNTGELAWAFYSPQAEATNPLVQNSHYSLSKALGERNHLDTDKRWCGFYSRIMGNGDDDFLILYGMSSDYPHNQYSDEIVKRFADKILLSKHAPSKVIIIGDKITIYTMKDVEPPF
jgi:hypothetical protein